MDGRYCSGSLLFLDVDGPLIPFGSAHAYPTYESGRLDQGASGHPLLERIDPAHGARLLALGCELVWATTDSTACEQDDRLVSVPVGDIIRAATAVLRRDFNRGTDPLERVSNVNYQSFLQRLRQIAVLVRLRDQGRLSEEELALGSPAEHDG